MKLSSAQKSALIKTVKTSLQTLPVPVLIETVIPLSESQISELTTYFQKSYPNAHIENQVNPSLVGGMLISFQGKQLDFSLSTSLQIS